MKTAKRSFPSDLHEKTCVHASAVVALRDRILGLLEHLDTLSFRLAKLEERFDEHIAKDDTLEPSEAKVLNKETVRRSEPIDGNAHLLTPEELADKLGVSVSTIYRWTSLEFVPHIKVGSGKRGGVVRFRKTDIEKWLERLKIGGRGKFSPVLD